MAAGEAGGVEVTGIYTPSANTFHSRALDAAIERVGRQAMVVIVEMGA